jgi:hypothetical protein
MESKAISNRTSEHSGVHLQAVQMSWEERKHHGATSRRRRDRVRTDVRWIYMSSLGRLRTRRCSKREDDLNEERGADGTAVESFVSRAVGIARQ